MRPVIVYYTHDNGSTWPQWLWCKYSRKALLVLPYKLLSKRLMYHHVTKNVVIFKCVGICPLLVFSRTNKLYHRKSVVFKIIFYCSEPGTVIRAGLNTQRTSSVCIFIIAQGVTMYTCTAILSTDTLLPPVSISHPSFEKSMDQ